MEEILDNKAEDNSIASTKVEYEEVGNEKSAEKVQIEIENRKCELETKVDDYPVAFKLVLSKLPKFTSKVHVQKFLNNLKIPFRHIRTVPMRKFALVSFETAKERDDAYELLKDANFKGEPMQVFIYSSNPNERNNNKNEELSELDHEDDSIHDNASNSDNETHSNKKSKHNNDSNEQVEEEIITSARSSVTPLFDLPYDKQINSKRRKMILSCAVKIVSETTKLYKTVNRLKNKTNKSNNEVDLPQWMTVSGELPLYVSEVETSPVITGYRNKCEFTIGYNQTGEKTIGFCVGRYKNGNVYVLPPNDCSNVSNKMVEMVGLFQNFINNSSLPCYNQSTHVGVYRQITIRESYYTNDLLVIFCVSLKDISNEIWEKEFNLLIDFVNNFPSHIQLSSFYLQTHDGWSAPTSDSPMKLIFGKDFLIDKLLEIPFQISPNSFFQTNTTAAEKLYSKIIELSKADENTILLDVCCGSGTIGLCVAIKRNIYKLIGIELNASAIEDANKNAALNNFRNTEFICSRAEDVIESILRQYRAISTHKIIAIVDPPRDGLHSKCLLAIRNCASINSLIYVSCNPTQSLVRDAAKLCGPVTKRSTGVPFIPKAAIPVDLFPSTSHCEMIVLFER